MKHCLLILVICSITLKVDAQQPLKQIKLSEFFSSNGISIIGLRTETELPDLYDTVKISFILNNDLDTDTAVYYSEASNDWFSFQAIPISNKYPSIQQVSGRRYFGKLAYDNVYFPVRKLLLKANTVYQCSVRGIHYKRGKQCFYRKECGENKFERAGECLYRRQGRRIFKYQLLQYIRRNRRWFAG